MAHRVRIALISLLAIASLAAAQVAQPGVRRSVEPIPLGPGLVRGVNFGNMLEAPVEGAWGLSVREEFFDRVVDAGLDHIRLPISWTHHAQPAAPYTIDPVFMARVQWCVDQALARGLKIIVNVHHYNELNADPAAERDRALAIWRQIAEAMQARPPSVVFEVLNEPHGAFNDDPALWDAFLIDALAVIRQSNPGRWVLAGPVRWNSVGALDSFSPPADRRLALTVHYYEPFAFTHQGASWVDQPPPVGTPWTGDLYVFAGPWANWSWGTAAESSAAGLSVTYQQGWAGLFFRRDTPLAGARRVVFTVDRALSLNVIVGNEAADQGFPVQTTGPGEYAVDLPPGFPPVDRVMLQNASPDPQPAYTLSAIRVETQDAAEPLIVTERQDVDRAMARAAAWGRARNMPVYLGEFGAYSTADMDSRTRWTRAVRESAEAHGIGWGYWELAAGFGFYDPDAGAFRQPLLDALTD